MIKNVLNNNLQSAESKHLSALYYWHVCPLMRF